jgi:hypothetical protein
LEGVYVKAIVEAISQERHEELKRLYLSLSPEIRAEITTAISELEPKLKEYVDAIVAETNQQVSKLEMPDEEKRAELQRRAEAIQQAAFKHYGRSAGRFERSTGSRSF